MRQDRAIDAERKVLEEERESELAGIAIEEPEMKTVSILPARGGVRISDIRLAWLRA